MMKSPYLEKKIKGIQSLVEIVNKVEHVIYRSKQYSEEEINRLKNFVCNFFEENKFLEIFQNTSLHIEIIKRLAEIVQFIARYGNFPVGIVEHLWQNCQNKHEEHLREFCKLIIDIFGSLSKECRLELFTLISQIPRENLNEILINLQKGIVDS